jgi:hypothetical protein
MDQQMTRKVLGFVVAPVLGLLAMVVPVLLWPPAAKHYGDAPLFPLIRNAVEGIGLAQLVLLFVAGVVLGLVSRSPAWLLGAAAISPLPIAALAEMIKDPTSHNLFPIEFAFYAVYGLFVAFGAFASHRLRRSWTPSGKASEGVV